MTERNRPGPAGAGLIVVLILSMLLAACGDDAAETTTTQAPTTTTQATTTTETATTTAETTTTAPGATISQIDLIAGMLSGLLTTEEFQAAIGLDWVDGGRQVIPAGSDQRTGFLCPEGQAILDPLGSAYDPQVTVRFSPPGDAGFSTWISESLLYEETEQNAADFATLVSALEACTGVDPWDTPEGGPFRIESLDLPAMGDQSYAVRLTMGEGDPTAWLETRAIGILVGPILVEVSAGMIHGAEDAIAIGDGGLLNVAEAALAKIQEGLADAESFTVAPADPEEVMSVLFLLPGLLTTEEVGEAWEDQGRMVMPTSIAGDGFGFPFLCPEGQAVATPIGSTLDRLVFTNYRREGSPRLNIGLTWGHEEDLTAAFDAGVTAVQTCFDREPWDSPDMGTLRMHALDLPQFGAHSLAYYLGPGAPPGADPWAEFQMVMILVTGLDPSNDISVVVFLEAVTVHDPANADIEMLDHAELARIAELAVGRFAYDG